MRESKFANHEGLSITFNDGSGYTFNPAPAYNYAYSPMLIGSKITGFSLPDSVAYPVEIGVKGNTPSDVADKFDRILALFKSDITANLPGKLTINGYTLDCFVSEMTPTQNLNTLKSANFVVYTDNPQWYKEIRTYKFTPDNEIILDSVPLEELKPKAYPLGYPYGYPNPYAIKKVRNPLYTPAQFKLSIKGPCTPSITIGGHVYAVNADISDGEMLTINSRTREITKRTADGSIINLFDSRNRESDIFQSIPVGDSDVAWNLINRFFLTLIDERLIPPWSV